MNRREFLKLGAGAGLLLAGGGAACSLAEGPASASLILSGGRIATLDSVRPFVEALAVREGRVLATGSVQEVMPVRGADTRVIDLRGGTAIPGLNDSHMHPIRAGLHYNLELRWDGISSLAEALERLRIQARNTPPPQWVRVVGGWSEFQFSERRMPTLEEINSAAPDTPVFILHLYDRALLNRAALRVLGYETHPPDFDRGLIQRDAKGRATGVLLAKPSALILYSTLGRGPKLGEEDQANSSRHFMRELNRLGVTSAIDAGGGAQSYPDDYAVIRDLAQKKLMTVRLGYDLFAQKAGEELVRDPLRHQVAVVVDEALLTVQGLRAGVRALDLEVERAHAELAAGLADELQCAVAESAAAQRVVEEDLVEKRVATAVLEAEAERERDVTAGAGAVLDEPDAPEPGIAQQGVHRRARDGLVECDRLVRVERAHQRHQRVEVAAAGAAKRDARTHVGKISRRGTRGSLPGCRRRRSRRRSRARPPR